MGCGSSKGDGAAGENPGLRLATDDGKNNLVYKVVLLGDVFVGKTSLLSCLQKQGISTTYSATIGFAYSQKSVVLKNGVS